VSVEQALRLYTQATAYMTFDEEDRGVLTPGKLADFVSIAEDILTIDPERIRSIQPVMTVIGGEIVYTAPSDSQSESNSQTGLGPELDLNDYALLEALHHKDC
jgi:hypothetical protein